MEIIFWEWDHRRVVLGVGLGSWRWFGTPAVQAGLSASECNQTLAMSRQERE
jgi:hypothetical protein